MSEYTPKNSTYSLEGYSVEWKERFAEIRKTLERIFGSKALRIEHVGSTAIEGMSAKPVIDVLVVVPNIANVDAERVRMQNLGYMYKKNYIAENSLFFCKDVDGKRSENIHVFPEAHVRIASFIDKREYFRTHPDEVRRYEELKLSLAAQFPNDYRAYAKGKNDYLNRELEEKVHAWKNGFEEL